MTSAQQEILARALKQAKQWPKPEDQLESVKASVGTHYLLYKQEKDQAGEALYLPVWELVNKVRSVQELEAYLSEPGS